MCHLTNTELETKITQANGKQRSTNPVTCRPQELEVLQGPGALNQQEAVGALGGTF